MSVDIHKEDFTVTGIGDMAGDVFGNGMLLSKHIKLVAAFNHIHIFFDPSPNPSKSLKERKRLFNKAGSTWLDYNRKLISRGGGVFERSQRLIKLSKEVQALLNVSATELSPDDLIKAILTSEVDLLWNGGIGTYVKSELESHADVGDKSNDNLRVNALDLKCKVVAEGGNLGFTQKGRIEYAKLGGRINTDAIDNSGGVDCSDHEVNIKIAMQKAMENKKLSLKKRNEILDGMTNEVAQLVLSDNTFQTQAITIAQLQGHHVLPLQARLIKKLESTGLLDRKIEFLPNDQEIESRLAENKGLYRPEISIILAYAKMDIYNELVRSKLTNDKYFTPDLLQYFPSIMRSKFKNEIEGHQLRKEIISTMITNEMVNRAGIAFYNHILENTGATGCDVARAFIVAKEIYNLDDIWKDIEALNGKIDLSSIKIYSTNNSNWQFA